MKHLKLLLLIIGVPFFAIGQNTYQTVAGSGDRLSSVVLTSYKPGKLAYNYRNCHFTIKAGNWLEMSSKYHLTITTTLTNDSNDTLIYEWDTDRWRSHFKIDTTYLKIDDPNSHHISDIDGSDIILPHKSMSYKIELTPKNDSVAFHGKIKVGIYLLIQRHPGLDVFGIVDGVTSEKIIEKYERDSRKRTHILWSNTVEI